jgi:predicted nucleotidyltransferase
MGYHDRVVKQGKIQVENDAGISGIKKILEDDRRVVFAFLFGSRARGEATPLSDVDIAVFLERGTDFSACKLDLLEKTADLPGSAGLDLVVLNTSSEAVTGRIVRDRVLLVDKRPHERHIFESVAARKFFDFSLYEGNLLRRRYGVG